MRRAANLKTLFIGEVAQAVAAFVMVQTALNWLVDNYPGLAECLSSVNRVGSLLIALDERDRDSPYGSTPVDESGNPVGDLLPGDLSARPERFRVF